MYSLSRTVPLPTLLLRQLPALVASLLIAENFYHFGSFSLECIAFLATWFATDFLWTQVLAVFRK